MPLRICLESSLQGSRLLPSLTRDEKSQMMGGMHRVKLFEALMIEIPKTGMCVKGCLVLPVAFDTRCKRHYFGGILQ